MTTPLHPDDLMRRLRLDRRRCFAITGCPGEGKTRLAVLRPLLRRVARTDRLIDFIVYRLYGLTEEEVAVVEGTRQ